jgi:hypothetical protein
MMASSSCLSSSNEKNWADQRIYELLKEKFKLFDGVFGASDEILGSIESGIDFEKRIYDIFDTCRKPEEIEAAFEQLQAELDQPIQEKLAKARQMLFEHFDADVHQRLRVRMESAEKRMDEVTRFFWELTKYVYTTRYTTGGYTHGRYYFNDDTLIFGTDEEFIRRGERPPAHVNVPIYYYLDSTEPTPEQKEKEALELKKRLRARTHKTLLTGYPHRLSGIEGQMVIKSAKELETAPAHVTFHLSKHKQHIGLLDEIAGKSGWLFLHKLTVDSFERVEQLLFSVYDDEGIMLKPEIGVKLFLLPAEVSADGFRPCPVMDEVESMLHNRTGEWLKQLEASNQSYFNEELDKLDHWAEDLKNGLELELKRLDVDIRELDRQSKQMISLQEKLEFQKQKAALEKRRTKRRHDLFTSQDDIDKKRDTLIKQIEKQLASTTHAVEELFRIQWTLC